jgi:hypothetical protein
LFTASSLFETGLFEGPMVAMDDGIGSSENSSHPDVVLVVLIPLTELMRLHYRFSIVCHSIVNAVNTNTKYCYF